MKTTTVPVIIGAFRLVKKGTENYIGKILGNIRITELQKTVPLGTARILRRTLGPWIVLAPYVKGSET